MQKTYKRVFYTLLIGTTKKGWSKMSQVPETKKRFTISMRAMVVFLLVMHCLVAFVVAPMTSNPASASWILFGWVPWLIMVYWIWGIVCTIVLFLFFYRGE